MKPEDETENRRSAILKTATSLLRVPRDAEHELRRTNEALEQRTRELAQAVVVMRATLESTRDAIVAVDESGTITDFNEQYINLWDIPRDLVERGSMSEIQKFTSRNFTILHTLRPVSMRSLQQGRRVSTFSS